MPEAGIDSAVLGGEPEVDGAYGEREGRKLSFALVWSFIQSFGSQGITVVVTFLLARELGPEVFGLAALAIVYVLFVEMLIRQGLTAAVIQRRDLTDADLDTAFWLVVAVASTIVLATIGLAGLWADINGEPQLEELTMVLVLVVPLRALAVIPDALYRRRLEFRALAWRSFVGSVLGASVALALAIAGAGVWALIWQQIVLVGTECLLLWARFDWRPTRRFSRPAARELVAYAGPSSAATVGLFVSERSDTVVTSIYFGPVAVGLHRFAVRFVDVLVMLFSGPFLQVSLPELARYQNDRPALSSRIVEIMHVSSLLAFPFFAGLAAAADDFVALAGDDWRFAATPLSLLSLAGAFKSLNFYSAPVLQALGRTRLLAITKWGQAIVKTGVVVVVAAALQHADIGDQVTGIAAASMVLEGFFLFGVVVPILWRTASVHPLSVLGLMMVPTAAAVAGVAAAVGVRTIPAMDSLPTLIAVGVTGGLGIGVAFGVELVFDRRLRVEIRQRLRR